MKHVKKYEGYRRIPKTKAGYSVASKEKIVCPYCDAIQDSKLKKAMISAGFLTIECEECGKEFGLEKQVKYISFKI